MKQSFVMLFVAVLVPALASAQVPRLTAPNVSPAASATQMIGLTEITVSYHRPAANGRKVWGTLVPYDQVWRAGANQNTTVSFSSPVTVNQPAENRRGDCHLREKRQGASSVVERV